MANEIDVNIGSLDLDSTNSIAVSDIDVQVAKSIREFDLPKFHGSIVPIGKRKSMIVRIRGTIIGSDYDALRTNLDTLKNGIEGTAEKNLTLDDDRYLKVQYRTFAYKYETLRRFANFSFDVIASDPFWYEASLTTVNPQSWTTGVGFTINNTGNAPCRLKVTITGGGTAVSDDIKFQNSTTGELFQYRGALTSSGVLVVNNKVDDDDVLVTKDGVDDIVNFEGDFITLNPGNNTLILTSAISNLVLRLDRRQAWY